MRDRDITSMSTGHCRLHWVYYLEYDFERCNFIQGRTLTAGVNAELHVTLFWRGEGFFAGDGGDSGGGGGGDSGDGGKDTQTQTHLFIYFIFTNILKHTHHFVFYE